MYNLQGKERIGESLYIFQKVLYVVAPILLIALIILKAPFNTILWMVAWAFLIKMIASLFYKTAIWNHIKLVLKKLGANPQEFKVRILKNISELNAFAAFEGNMKAIYLTDKVLKTCTKDEVNFIIAHEYAHHVKKHLVTKLYTEMFSGLFLLGINFATKGSSKKGKLSKASIVLMVVNGLLHLVKKAVYRMEELEADLTAVHLLENAKIPFDGAISFFERIKKIDGSHNNAIFMKILTVVFSDHPSAEDRKKTLLEHAMSRYKQKNL